MPSYHPNPLTEARLRAEQDRRWAALVVFVMLVNACAWCAAFVYIAFFFQP